MSAARPEPAEDRPLAARPPAGVLPAPAPAPLPPPIPLRRMIGPSVVLAGLAIGSGEYVLWPRLTAEWGLALFWGAWVGVTLQFFLDMEIERYTLATGESAVTGFVRLGRGWGPAFLLAGTLPWIWPGWATGAATILEWRTGLPAVPAAIAGLLLCAVLLSAGSAVYRTVERIELALVAALAVVLGTLALLVIDADACRSLAAGAARLGHVPEGLDLPLFLGALAFAGAGGTVNLAQSNYVKDKGYAMGARIAPLAGLRAAAEDPGVVGFAPLATAELPERWRAWWTRTNLEHLLAFHLVCVGTLAAMCAMTETLFREDRVAGADFGFVAETARRIEARVGPLGRELYLLAGVLVLFTTELALLDAVARVAADAAKSWALAARGRLAGALRRRSLAQLYFAFVWGIVAFGVVVLAAGFDRPLALLVLSSATNGGVMAVYALLLLVLNRRALAPPLRPGPLRVAAVGGAAAFYGTFAVLALAARIGGG